MQNNNSLYISYFYHIIKTHTVVVTTSLRMTNRLLSKLKSEVFYRNHKKNPTLIFMFVMKRTCC